MDQTIDRSTTAPAASGPATPSARRSLQREGRPAALAVLAGGSLAIVGTALRWTSISLERAGAAHGPSPSALPTILASLELNGLHSADGRLVFGLAVALVLLSVLAWTARTVDVRLGMAPLAIALAAVATSVSAVLLGTGGGLGAAQVPARLVGHLQESPAIGLYLAFAGAVLALLGAFAILGSHVRSRTAPMRAASVPPAP